MPPSRLGSSAPRVDARYAPPYDGTTLTVWVGPQTDNDVRFQATKEITVSGDRIVVFTAADNELP